METKQDGGSNSPDCSPEFTRWLKEVDRIWELLEVDPSQSVGVRPIYAKWFGSGRTPGEAVAMDRAGRDDK